MATVTDNVAQLRPDGSLRHLLTLEGLSRAQLEQLLERAQTFVRPLGTPPPIEHAARRASRSPTCSPSPRRARASRFELAAKRLGAEVVNLEVQLSSRVKGESMLDTVFTLESLHVDVVRDPRRRGRRARRSWPRTSRRT